ncbi:hypothetical protein [Candidatus Reidiella endopervernicosa]|uniref:Uncharacterized protein n=1 Tax=Candidatus Reidiella endopervernicosa TaxID=2738883 RepID=A0A6N0HVK0_9GAMM|nr:hypothetical protein [Candidatus Reidiella endopervernicosa]QKQ26414.1 hypothetical protein HUE57_09060 [Candidatus Reidiella endopervernicosa]
MELLEQLTAMIEKSAFGEQQIRPALATLLERYNNRFGSIPFNEQRALLRWLERNDFPAQETLTLSLTLEELFEKQHRQPLHDNERLLAKLVAQNRDSASAVESLLHGLINAYQSHNNRPLDNLQAPLQNSLLNGSLSEADARDAIASLTESFRDRFGRSPFEREESASVSHIDSARLASHDESN